MNSLTYLSNQFDAIASPRTPPSTPTSEYPSPSSDSPRKSHADPSELKRVKTWSNRRFLFAHSPHIYPRSSPPKRSFSSPADFITFPSMRPSPTVSASLDANISPNVHLQSVIHRIFFIRLFVLLWRLLCEAWASMTTRDRTKTKENVVLQVVSDSDEKDSEDEKPPIPHIQEPSVPPLPPDSSYLSSPEPPHVIRSHTDPTLPSEAKSGPQSLCPASLVTDQAGASRSSTPLLTARKTPFHLPKTLVLDLDETLVHSTSRPMHSSGSGGGLLGFGRRNKAAGHIVDVVLGGRSTLYHVYKRPFVDFFLRTVCL
jgi:CTD nuclear envelope phosphatase 1